MHYNIWTDGACSKNGTDEAIGGWAYIIVDPYRRIIKSDSAAARFSTNNQMEMTAVVKGLKAFDEINTSGFDTCSIITDSAYIFNCKEQHWYRKWESNGWKSANGKPVKNIELWKEIIPYFDKINITWEKVRGHNGVSFNEMVDEMAVKARKEYNHG